MRKLDLYSCAGGAAKGYKLAGYDEVVGVDLFPQKNYPFTFVQADALEFMDSLLADDGRFGYQLGDFDSIHGSPPCHDHTPLTAVAGVDGTAWLLAATRERFIASGLPWVIENVPGAPMRTDLLLCGHMFGLRTQRHRWFELSPRAGIVPPLPHVHRPGVKTATKQRRQRWDEGWDVSVTGDVGVYVGPEALGIDWMTGNELSQAIPPAYTRYIGEFLLDTLSAEAAA